MPQPRLSLLRKDNNEDPRGKMFRDLIRSVDPDKMTVEVLTISEAPLPFRRDLPDLTLPDGPKLVWMAEYSDIVDVIAVTLPDDALSRMGTDDGPACTWDESRFIQLRFVKTLHKIKAIHDFGVLEGLTIVSRPLELEEGDGPKYFVISSQEGPVNAIGADNQLNRLFIRSMARDRTGAILTKTPEPFGGQLVSIFNGDPDILIRAAVEGMGIGHALDTSTAALESQY